MKQKNIVKNYDNVYTVIKVFIMFLVVLSHCTQMYAGSDVVDLPVNPPVKKLNDYLYVFHMPAFMLTSGSIYRMRIDAGKYENLFKFIVVKAKRLLVPYFFVGLLFVAPTMVYLKLTDDSVIGYFFKGIVLGTNKRHLWYLLVLFMYLVGVRIIKPVLDRFPACDVVLFIIAIPMNLLSRGFAPFFYFVYFILGYLFIRYRIITQILEKTCYLIPIFMFLTGLSIRFLSPIAGIIASYQLAFCISRYVYEKKWFRHFSRNGMGIYLFHPMIIHLVFYWCWGWNWNPWFACLVVFIIAIVISDFIIELFRKIGLKFLLGE